MQLPTAQDIEALHKKYAPTPAVLALVFTHCQIINDIAQQLIAQNNLDVDAELVHAACLLHDIGVYPLFDKAGKERQDLHYITHGVRGEAILKEEGFPEVIWRFASHHTGVGLAKSDIVSQNLPLPEQNYLAETSEEELVMYADKFHSKEEPPCFNSYEWYKHYVSLFGEHKAQRFEQLAQKFGIPDLTPCIKKYGHVTRDLE
ncbi:MAG TPA: HD domain-containing protein [Candidatus Saccharimonadales bacterium]|jgi:uncharacterized protein|nr:HD domain-containing protein [Candidatus Saccharimonadales bacterium]